MIETMRRVALVMVTTFSLGAMALPALAQEIAPDHLALARKYIDLTDKVNVYEQALVNTGVEIMRTVLSQNPDLGDPLESAIIKSLDYYKERKGELLDQFARLYANRFTVEELQAIVNFYESPVGIKLAESAVQLNTDTKNVMNIWESNLRTEFFAKVKAELKLAGYTI